MNVFFRKIGICQRDGDLDMSKKLIGIIGAMASEVELLKGKMTGIQEVSVADIEFCYGFLEGLPAVIAECGIGKVCAAMCAQAMIDNFEVYCLINTGVAGGLAHGLEVGDIVISRDAIQHDFDATAFGYVRGFMPGEGDSSQPTRYYADQGLLASFKQAADTVLTGNKWIEGTIVSGDIFVDDSALKQSLIEQFNASAAEMEGAAIAQVASANGVPFIIIRAISDLAEKEANVTFDVFEKKAAEVSSAIVLGMCKNLSK